MKPVVSSLSLTFSFPGADEDFILLVYDALKDYEDSHFRVSLDVDGRIHVSLDLSVGQDVDMSFISERAGSYVDFITRRVESAVDVATRRYKLRREIERIETALGEGIRASILEDLVPSVW